MKPSPPPATQPLTAQLVPPPYYTPAVGAACFAPVGKRRERFVKIIEEALAILDEEDDAIEQAQ